MKKPVTIKSLQNMLGIKRKELARLAAVDISTISRWDTKGIPKRGPAKALLEKLAEEARSAA